jgi:hypothetical protein
MGIIKEPKDVDFSVESTPWSEEELRDFRRLMEEIKTKNKKRKQVKLSGKKLKQGAV